MKTPARTLLLAAWASLLTLAFTAVAQDNPKPAPAPKDQPAADVTPAQPAVSPTAPADEKSALRRLDVPESATAQPAGTPAEPADRSLEATESGEAAPADHPMPEEEQGVQVERRGQRRHYSSGSARVAIFHDSSLAEGQTAEAVISILGSSTSAGNTDAVVSVGGSSTSSGDVGNAVVSVLGGSRVTAGSVGDSVVSVLGNTYVNAPVAGQVVTILGNVELGPNADVGGQLVCVGGEIIRDPKAVVRGETANIVIGRHFGNFDWLHAWVAKCLIYGRPLAFGAHLMWAWWLALGALALYALLALLFPRGVEKCVATLEEHPGRSILTAFLVTLITPAAAVLLAITIIGTPALIVCLFISVIFGKVVMLAWLGRRFTRLFGEGKFAQPVIAVLVGGVIVLLLYTVPIVGFVVSKLISWLGLGVVVYTVIRHMKRNKPVVTAAQPATAAPGVVPPAVSSVQNPTVVAATDAAGVVPGEPTADPAMPLPPTPLPVTPMSSPTPPRILAPTPAISASTLPRAGFWIRIAASLLDVIVVGIAFSFLPHHLRPNFLLVFAVYCTVLWALKGTTVGGIVCGLKVVRLDDRPLDWPTAIVRVLGGFLSLVAAGLGFIWVAFDDHRQSWHDKIAGTTVVHVPKGVSLL